MADHIQSGVQPGLGLPPAPPDAPLAASPVVPFGPLPPPPPPPLTAMSQARSERLTITVVEAARLLGIGRNQAYEAVRRGEIPSNRYGKRIVVPRAALERKLRGE